MYETINSPINYGGLELKNRIIFAPTTFGLAEDEYFEKIRKIAAGGCAMVIIGDVPVGKSQFEKSLFDKKGFAHYQKLVEIVHSYDCRICAQLHRLQYAGHAEIRARRSDEEDFNGGAASPAECRGCPLHQQAVRPQDP